MSPASKRSGAVSREYHMAVVARLGDDIARLRGLLNREQDEAHEIVARLRAEREALLAALEAATVQPCITFDAERILVCAGCGYVVSADGHAEGGTTEDPELCWLAALIAAARAADTQRAKEGR